LGFFDVLYFIGTQSGSTPDNHIFTEGKIGHNPSMGCSIPSEGNEFRIPVTVDLIQLPVALKHPLPYFTPFDL
jgi:hypothetical protein